MPRFSHRKLAAALVIALAVLLSAPHPVRALLATDENAIDLLGQFGTDNVTPDYTKGCADDGASQIGYDLVGNNNPMVIIDTVDHRLYVSDTANNRVLVYTLTGGNLVASKTPSYVLGQPDLVSCAAALTQSGLNTPEGMDFDAANNRLFVADAGNDRVLVYNTSSLSNGMNAASVLGQPDFVSNGDNTTQSGMDAPQDVKYDSANNRLFVVDSNNNRVLVFGTGTITNGMNASYELGQPGGASAFTTAGPATTQSGMSYPLAIAYDSTQTLLYVVDSNNNRVLTFNVAPGSIANGENAANVLGQADFVSNGADVTQSGMDAPVGAAVDSTHSRLFVSECGNSRVTVFSTSGLTNGENASNVLGQPDFNEGGWTTQWGLSCASGDAYDSTNNQLYVADQVNNRVMIFNTSTTIPASSAVTQSGLDACAISSGALYCWGWNGYGEDGTGDEYNYLVPQHVGAATNWTAVSQSDPSYYEDSPGFDACGIAGGALYCWGDNGVGELGLGNTTQYTTPQRVGADTTWTVISSGAPDACGIDNGRLYCWGLNNYGEDGLGNTTQNASPQPVGALTTWTAVSQGGADACGIAGGRLYCWGQNYNGELGLGNTTQYTTPQQVGADTTWTAVSQGVYDTCGIDSGKLYCWGWDPDGELGLGNTTQYMTPQRVGADATWTAISIRNDNSTDGGACGIDSGKLYCWGLNANGELGLGNTTQYMTPQRVGTDTTWTAVSFGGSDACGIDNGTLYCWGENEDGELGLGSGTPYTTPQPVPVNSFANGEDASDELGQYTSLTSTATVTYTQSAPDNGLTAFGFSAVTDVAADDVHHRLFVADAGNNRVLVYNLNPDNSLPDRAPDYVLGQPDFLTTGEVDIGQASIESPNALAYDSVNDRLFVVDPPDNRVLVFNTSSITDGMNASYELGQPGGSNAFTTFGNGHTAATFNNPGSLAYDSANTRLFVSDYNNNRVLVFNVAPGAIANGEAASAELGQPSGTAFTSKGSGHSSSTFNGPDGVGYDSGNARLFLSDARNNRVLVFNAAPGFANGEAASYVLGQTNFTNDGANTTQSTLYFPKGLSYDPANSRLFVADLFNQRVLVFNAAPGALTNGENASYVLGQTNFTNAGVNTTQSGMALDYENVYDDGVKYDPATGRLFVSDTYNNRVMIFDGSYLSSKFLLVMPR